MALNRRHFNRLRANCAGGNTPSIMVRNVPSIMQSDAVAVTPG